MPVTIDEDPSGYGYEVKTPSGKKGSKMTLRNAIRQKRLLNALDHGWTPDRGHPPSKKGDDKE